jgi:heptosyltransferase I
MKFLIIKTSSIGDIIQAFPVAAYLKQKFPQATIDWVVEHEYLGLIEANPHIHQAIAAQSRSWRGSFTSAMKEIPAFIRRLRQQQYDAVFDLQGNTKSALITLWSRALEKVGFGWKSVPEVPSFFAASRHIEVEPELHIQQRYLRVVQHFFGDEESFSPPELILKLTEAEQARLQLLCQSTLPRVMVACGSRWINKRISEERLKEILTQLKQEKECDFYFISGNEEELKSAHNLASHFSDCSHIVQDLTLPLWQALMREMDLVVAVDSAALALCGMTLTPSKSFFGPSLASIYKPVGDHHVAFQGSCPYGLKFKARCPRLRTCKTGACLKK